MATSEINYSANTVVDLASDTVTEETLLEGTTAHDATGASITGTMHTVPDSEKLGGLSASSYVNSIATYYSADSYVEGETGDVDILTDPFALVPIGTDKNVALYEALGSQGAFAYVHTWFYSTQSTKTSRYQTAVIYNNFDQRFVFRVYYSGSWGAWTSSDNANKLGNKAPEYYIQPRNLLDNSDFTNPVNQRGFISGSALGNEAYFIDRWRNTWKEDPKWVQYPVFDENGLRGMDANEGFVQIVDLSQYIGKEVTIAIYGDYDNPTHCASGTVVKTDSWSYIAASQNWECNLTYNGYAWSVNVRVPCKYIALYTGAYTADTLPPYVPKGYAVELAECQRYYRVLKDICFMLSNHNQGLYRSDAVYYGDMRTYPTRILIQNENNKVGIVQMVEEIPVGTTDIQFESDGLNTTGIATSKEAWAGRQVKIYMLAISADL